MGTQDQCYLIFPTFPEPLFSLLCSLLSIFSHICYCVHPLSSLLSALVSLLSSLFSSVYPAARRLSLRDPPPPAWQGSRACETGARHHQISSESELRGAPHLAPSPMSWRSSIAQNAVLDPPMASKMPSWSLQRPPDRKIMQMSEQRTTMLNSGIV